MTLNEAVATYAPAWVGIWINVLLVGAVVLPLSLIFWKQTRWVAVFALIAGLVGGLGITFMYAQMGYVRLLGLPHIIAWTPLAVVLITKIRAPEVSTAPRAIMGVTLATIAISLAFDMTDTVRYIAGDRTPVVLAMSTPS